MSIFTPILDVDLEIMKRLDDKSVYTIYLVNKFIKNIIIKDPSEYNSLYYKMIRYKYHQSVIMKNLRSVTWICKYNNVIINVKSIDINKLQLPIHNLEIYPYRIRFQTSSDNVINAIEKIVLYHGKNFYIEYIHCYDTEVYYDDSVRNFI